MTRLWALVVKELRALLKDRRARLILVAPPLMQLFLFAYAATFELERVPIAVWDEDGGREARELLARFAGSPHFAIRRQLHSGHEVAALLDQGEVRAVVHLAEDFGARLARGEVAPVQLLLDGRNSNTALLVQGYAAEVVARFAARGGDGAPGLTVRSWYNPNLESRWFFVPGLVAVLSFSLTLVVTALSVAREREAGTFDQLLVTPLSSWEILAGKSLPGVVVGMAEGTLILVAALLWFRVPLEGSLAALYLGMVLFALAAVGVGLMISALAVTQQQALLGAFLFLVPAVILSGFATPIANMPEPVQWLTRLDPLRYFLVVVRGVFLEGAGVAALADQYWPLLPIALASLAAAGLLFRRRSS
ncbi:MAG: antibiotic ABC transporter permease [Porticoccaceae bacterium]|nr:MAG: antibiotic ABC transporter permease [Porticoccaceae bacterium]